MTKRERIGVIGIVVAFIVSIVILILTSRTPWGPPKAPEDSVFVHQHLKNVQKGE
ncbi:MAG TPA: hypothetical protein PLI09_12445 [Candidatus Hydrogenedentes bacterium]|nr:hypothetical protein [Candidatus Hydrogenedentota bacterium]